MKKHSFRDRGIRPRGSPEIAYDPFILVQMLEEQQQSREGSKKRRERVANVFNFILKIAMEILPPKQRELFYSIWGKHGGKMSKGVMEYSRKKGQSHYSNYNSTYKSFESLRRYLDKSGYTDHILSYLRGEDDDEGIFE
jgi:hypothetical protein